MSSATRAAFSSVVAALPSTTIASSGTPLRTASRFMSSADGADSESSDAPENTRSGAYRPFHRAIAVSTRAPVASPEIATIASAGASGSETASRWPTATRLPASVSALVSAPRTKPSTNRLTRTSVAGALGRRGRAVCLGAVRGVQGAVGAWGEGDVAGTAAVAAHDVMHVVSSRGGSLGLGATAAVRAALRLVEQALLRVELLLAGGPHESVAALPAGQGLVAQDHRHRRALPGGR